MTTTDRETQIKKSGTDPAGKNKVDAEGIKESRLKRLTKQ